MTRFSTVNADTLLMVESLNRKNEKTNKKGTKLSQLFAALQRK